jgi:hypothetical protein
MSKFLEDAVREVQALRQKAVDYHDEYDRPYTEVEGGWLDEDGSWKDWESEAEGASCEARIDAYDEVLAILAETSPGWRT